MNSAALWVPVTVVVLAALWNQYSLSQLRTEMNARFDSVRAEMNGRFDTVDVELRFFHGKTGELTGRVDELSKRVNG